MSKYIDLKNVTHEIENQDFVEILREIKNKITMRGDLSFATIKYQLGLVEDLSQFPLGIFFLARKGANGFWTDYIINYPNQVHLNPSNVETNELSFLEEFILNRCPLTIATRERFNIFQGQIQNRLKDGIVVASIPCGGMRDLLSLNYSNMTDYKLIGVDIDHESILFARKLAEDYGLVSKTEFYLRDAWNLEFSEELDLITSNGLNVYEPDEARVMDLYKQFYKALKPGGVLVIGVLTYPPGSSRKTEWNLEEMCSEDILLEQILFQDILGCKWRNFRTTDEIYRDFHLCGYSNVSIYYDKLRIFPTIVAQK